MTKENIENKIDGVAEALREIAEQLEGLREDLNTFAENIGEFIDIDIVEGE